MTHPLSGKDILQRAAAIRLPNRHLGRLAGLSEQTIGHLALDQVQQRTFQRAARALMDEERRLLRYLQDIHGACDHTLGKAA